MFNNNFGNLAIKGLHEIELPIPVSYMQQTIGLYILSGCMSYLIFKLLTLD